MLKMWYHVNFVYCYVRKRHYYTISRLLIAKQHPSIVFCVYGLPYGFISNNPFF